MTPASIRVAFDGGWTDGDPGSGRLRFDSPRIASAKHLYINARDAQDAILDEWVPTWRVGDVIVIERPGAERNRVVAWVVGAVYHRGSYWRVPVSVRTVYGAFAAHDELALHHAANDVATDVVETPPLPPSIPEFSKVHLGGAPALTPLAPLAANASPAPDAAPMAASAPQSLAFDMQPTVNAIGANGDRLTELEAENLALQKIIERLVSDDTPLYVAEGTR